MCKCTPEIRTPFCGRGDCLPPASRSQDMEREFATNVEREAAAQASLDRVWAQAVRQSQMTTVPSANTELCADHKWLANSNVRTCGGCLAAKLAESEARVTALKEALELAKDWGCFGPGMTIGGFTSKHGNVSKEQMAQIVARALAGEGR